jgi:hypothetical protein
MTLANSERRLADVGVADVVGQHVHDDGIDGL